MGLSVATGEYVVFVDSDDFVDLDMYKHMIDSLKKRRRYLYLAAFAIGDSFYASLYVDALLIGFSLHLQFHW